MDVRHSLSKWKSYGNKETFDLDTLSTILASATMFIHEIFKNLSGNPSSLKYEFLCYIKLGNNRISLG